MAYRNIHINTTTNNNQPPTGGNGNQSPTGPLNIQQVLQSDDMPDILIDYADLAEQGKIHTTMFRETITKRLLTSLSTKTHPNVLLIGPAGVGKTAIVEDLAVRIHQKDPLITQVLKDYYHIYELPLSNLIAGSSIRGELEAKLQAVVNFISDPANHAILFLDEIHQLVSNPELKTVGEILKPALARDAMHVIGSTTTQEKNKYWDQAGALTRRFSNVMVNELTADQTKQILEQVLPRFQQSNLPVGVDPACFDQIITVGDQYAATLGTHRPDSALRILDQALAMARIQALELKQQQIPWVPALNRKLIAKAGQTIINSDHNGLTRQTVVNLQTQLQTNLIGQAKAKDVVVQAVQSMVLNLVPQTKPHSFLFPGPTGTGKTEMAKQLATVLFGRPDAFIYLNMTEYAHGESLNRLIGSPRGYIGSNSVQPLPLDGLKTDPFQLVLLDEFEKASPDVQRIFMQALDEGQIQYNDDSTVSFRHAIIIATTNAGADHFDQQPVGFGANPALSEHDVMTALSTNFPPELLNRFEYIVPFNSLTKAEYQAVVALKLNHFLTQLMQQQPDYHFANLPLTVDHPWVVALTDASYNPAKNGRPAERIVRHQIERLLLANPALTDFDPDQLSLPLAESKD